MDGWYLIIIRGKLTSLSILVRTSSLWRSLSLISFAAELFLSRGTSCSDTNPLSLKIKIMK